MVGESGAARLLSEPSGSQPSIRSGNQAQAGRAASARLSRRWLIFDLAVVMALAVFPCIYDIAGNSFGEGDQTTHAKVAQEMLHDGHWLFPTNKGRPYINKPPFKIWLSTIPVSLLGESTFSYRILDGITGVLTIGAIFLFAAVLFRSRLAGYVAALAQAGCSGWFFGHGVREAVQDGMMIFLVTLALICGYYFVELAQRRPEEYREPDVSRRMIKFAALGGLFVGLGLMTKSAAALVAPIIIGAWLVVSGRLMPTLRNGWREMVLALTIMAAIPSMFFVPYFIARPSAMWMVFNTEVFKRATKGYHNVHHPWFYFNILAKERAALPPELLLLLLVAAVFFALTRKDGRYSFLACWSIVPVLAYSASKSKLAWYINPAYPGMSILAGGVIATAAFFAWRGLRSWSFSSPGRRAGAALAAVFTLAAVIALGWNAQAVAARVYQSKNRNRTDLIVSGIQANRRAGWPPGRIIAYDYGKFNNHERLYWEMVGVEYITDPAEFGRAIDDPNLAFVITQSRQFPAIAPLRPFESYAFLPPKYIRRRWAAVIGYRDEPLPGPMIPAAWGTNFAEHELEEGFGLENTMVSGNRAIRRSMGSRSGLILEGDLAGATLGYKVSLRLSPLIPCDVNVYANTIKIADLSWDGEGFRSFEFLWPSNRVERGKNLLTFEYKAKDGRDLTDSDHAAAFETIEFQLNQPTMPDLRVGRANGAEKKAEPADSDEQDSPADAESEAGNDGE